MIRRHSRSAMAMHWFNAVCWFTLTFTGFALLANPAMQPIGQWWVNMWTGLFGAQGLLLFHVGVGLMWLAVYIAYIAVALRREVWPFLAEVFYIRPVADTIWCVKKGLWLTVGPKKMRAMGLDPELSPQGFYNAGQKIAAVVAVFTGAGLAVSGIVLALLALQGVASASVREFAQAALLLHFVCAGLMAVVLPVHIYMAALAPGEGPAFRSMFTGYVPEKHAREHNPLWHATLAAAAPTDPNNGLSNSHR